MPKTFGAGGVNFEEVWRSMSVGYHQKLHDESTVQKAPLGAVKNVQTETYMYVKANATVGAGMLVANDLSASGVVEVDNKATAAAAGASSVILTDSGTLGSATADQYAGAKLMTTDDDGEGYAYDILSNTAASSNAVTFTLAGDQVIKVALTTSTDVAIVPHPAVEIIGYTAGTDYAPVGVAMTALADGEFGWVCTHGRVCVLADGTIAIGDQLTGSDGETGAVQLADALTEAAVGHALFAPDNTGYVGMWLSL